jgi:CheY-like chemotaxis protein
VPERSAALQGGAAGPELTVLVVDDDLLVSAGTAAMLEDLGHRVLEASSGNQALDVLQRHGRAIDVVITDHAMPGMTGLELARLLKESHPALPIVLASGYAEIDDAAEFAALPRLAKPFRQSELASAIATARGTPAMAGGNNVVPFVVHA